MQRRLLFLFPALLIFWNLGYAPFWNPDEGRYAAASYEMAFGLGPTQPNWIVPHLDTVARLNKPPLVYWATGGAFKLFGPAEWSGRLPSALAALVVMVLIAVWGARAWSARAGFGAAMVWATATFPAAMSRTCNTDMLLTASVALSAFGLFWLIEAPALPASAVKSSKTGATVLAGVGMGLALLSKGPVGIALPVAIMLVYVIWARRWASVPWGACLLALGLGLLMGLPWYFAVEAQRPGFIKHFIFAENLSRFSGQQEYHKPTSKLFYLPIVLVGLFPWTAFLLPTLGSWREDTDLARRSRLFLALWAGFIVLFFSMSGTKLISYILPAFPALALLMGATLARWEILAPKLRGATVAFSLVVSLVLCVALIATPKRNSATKRWGLAPGVLRDGKIVQFDEGNLWTKELCALLALGAVLLIVASRRPNGKTLLATQGIYGALAAMMLVQLAGGISPYEDGSGVVTALVPQLQKGDEVVCYKSFLPTAMFYARRPIIFSHFLNTSGLDEAEIKKSPYFTLQGEAVDVKGWLAKRKNRVFVIAEGAIDTDLRPGLFLWGRNTDFTLYCNRLKPADFRLDTFAPLKPMKQPGTKRSKPTRAAGS